MTALRPRRDGGRTRRATSRLNVSGSTSTSTGARAAELDGVRRRRERVGRDDHLVARADPEREQREVERRGAGRDGDGVRRADTRRRARPRTRRPSGPSSADRCATTSATAASSASPTSGRASRIGSVTLVRSLAVPRDRPLEALVEVDLRLEAEQLARLARRSGCAARRRCSGAAGRRSRRGSRSAA